MRKNRERLSEIKGISERKAQDIYVQFHEKQDMRQIDIRIKNMVFLPRLL